MDISSGNNLKKKKVNMYYIEHNTVKQVIEGYKKFFKDLFSEMGYSLNIVLSSDPNNQDNHNVIDDNDIDIIVSDIMLGGSTYAGLDIIRLLKKDYPEIPVIAFSESNVKYADVSNKIPSFDLLIHKSRKNDKEYIKYIQSKISELFRVNVIMKIDEANSDLDDFKEDSKSRKEFERLLKRITFTSHNAPINTCVANVELKKITGGYSGSRTYRMYSRTMDGQTCINSILKVSDKEDAKQEAENYYNYVSWYLPYTWRPEMISHVMGKNKGIICYSFAYDDQSPFCSLTDHIMEGKVDKINLVIDKVFKPSNHRWYNTNKIKVDKPINEYYFQKFFSNRDTPITEFQRIAEICDLVIEGEYIKQKNKKYPLPSLLFSRDLNNSYQTHICHGDLNSNNILISNDDNMIFIDFQDTGLGHVFLDFIVFETCLKIYYKQNLGVVDLMELEKLLSSQEMYEDNGKNIGAFIGNPMFGLMHKIRKYAFENSPDEEKINYLYGVTVCAYKLFRLRLEDWQKSQLMACILANLPIIEEKTKI